jgi:hypothetical protein
MTLVGQMDAARHDWLNDVQPARSAALRLVANDLLAFLSPFRVPAKNSADSPV